jgi:hypothetical protein
MQFALPGMDAAGNAWWGGPQSAQPIAGGRLYIEKAGAIAAFFNDSSQSAGHRMWGLRTVNSGGAFQIAAETDDGSGQNAGLQVNRNGTLRALRIASVCAISDIAAWMPSTRSVRIAAPHSSAFVFHVSQ